MSNSDLRSGIGALVFVALYGCSGSTTDSTAPDAASGQDCNTLVNDGPTVIPQAVAADPPAPIGGTIADGRWVLTEVLEYTGPGGRTGLDPKPLSSVFVIAGSSMQQVGTVEGALKRYTSTFSVAGTTLTTTDTCPVPKTAVQQLSASPDQFKVYESVPGLTIETTFTKK